MTEVKAMKILNLDDKDITGLTIVKLSRQFAKMKQNIESDTKEFEELYEAYEFMRNNFTTIKNSTGFIFPENFFPTINNLEDTKELISTVLNIEVEHTPTELSTATNRVSDHLFIQMPKGVKTKDTIVFAYDKRIYESTVISKNITQKEHEELMNRCHAQ